MLLEFQICCPRLLKEEAVCVASDSRDWQASTWPATDEGGINKACRTQEDEAVLFSPFQRSARA